MTAIPRLSEDPRAWEALARAKVAYTDLDGTVLGRGGCLLCDLDGNPTLAGAAAVAAVNEAGFDTVIVSGRTVPMLHEITRVLGWQDFIAEMGSIRGYRRGEEIVYDLGEWDPDAVTPEKTPYEMIEEAGAIRALHETFPGRIEYHTPHHVGREASHLLRGHVDEGEAQAVLDSLDLPTSILDNGIINAPQNTLDAVEKVHAYHVMPKGVSKSAAIAHDLDRRGLTRDEAVMIGDSLADLDAHSVVSHVILMQNALRSPAVRERGPSVENLSIVDGGAGDGWAEFARAWLSARQGA